MNPGFVKIFIFKYNSKEKYKQVFFSVKTHWCIIKFKYFINLLKIYDGFLLTYFNIYYMNFLPPLNIKKFYLSISIQYQFIFYSFYDIENVCTKKKKKRSYKKKLCSCNKIHFALQTFLSIYFLLFYYYFYFRYNLLIFGLTYIIPMTVMAICYTLMGRKLWGSKSIGEHTQHQKDSMKSKRKVGTW